MRVFNVDEIAGRKYFRQSQANLFPTQIFVIKLCLVNLHRSSLVSTGLTLIVTQVVTLWFRSSHKPSTWRFNKVQHFWFFGWYDEMVTQSWWHFYTLSEVEVLYETLILRFAINLIEKLLSFRVWIIFLINGQGRRHLLRNFVDHFFVKCQRDFKTIAAVISILNLFTHCFKVTPSSDSIESKMKKKKTLWETFNDFSAQMEVKCLPFIAENS